MSPNPSKTSELDLERGRPSADEALVRLRASLATCRRTGVKYVRVIHGYGSTGAGGAIRTAARAHLSGLRREGRLRGFLPGERFGPADPESVALAVLLPELKRLPDWAAGNPGISIVVL